ncbi:MAG TPA: aminodeoxychorismate synthase component I, partial [Burkholderiaceae bacterium]
HDPAAPRLRHAFSAPCGLFVAYRQGEVRAVLDAAHAAARQGAWCVGYVCYEAAPAFDAALQVHTAPPGKQSPLAWFAAFDQARPWPEPAPATAAEVDWAAALERPVFDAALARIQQAIAAGELYQVNYTAQRVGSLRGGATALFAALRRAQPGGYAAYIDTGDTDDRQQVLSVSPELFFDWQADGIILARPMKGTAPRGATAQQDAERAAALCASPKERAENVMIVDLLRNDLSRIAQPHSVRVPALFRAEALPTVWQMTSDVQARTRPGTRLSDVFAALFPCGSVTGAPKVRAMAMIRALEPGPRGVYCGAVGVLRPGGAATFNVPIRTLALQGSQVSYGIGSGITADAQAGAEWDEWRYKSAFVERASAPFDILETLALENGALRHRDEHLARMAEAATYFGYLWQAQRVARCLDALAQSHPQGLWRVRLLLGATGAPRAEAFAQQAMPQPVRLRLAARPLEAAHGEFVRYKTTRRAHYDAFTPTQPGLFDTVLWNAEGEITECTRGNVAMLLDGRWVTPPLACGLLSGVGRALALRQGRLQEAVVRVQDAPSVQGWAFVNSLRGWLAAELVQG